MDRLTDCRDAGYADKKSFSGNFRRRFGCGIDCQRYFLWLFEFSSIFALIDCSFLQYGGYDAQADSNI